MRCCQQLLVCPHTSTLTTDVPDICSAREQKEAFLSCFFLPLPERLTRAL